MRKIIITILLFVLIGLSTDIRVLTVKADFYTMDTVNDMCHLQYRDSNGEVYHLFDTGDCFFHKPDQHVILSVQVVNVGFLHWANAHID